MSAVLDVLAQVGIWALWVLLALSALNFILCVLWVLWVYRMPPSLELPTDDEAADILLAGQPSDYTNQPPSPLLEVARVQTQAEADRELLERTWAMS